MANTTIINKTEIFSLNSNKINTQNQTIKQHVFIIGSKGIPASYGGFETFVEKLTKHQVNKNIQYHVARLSDNNLPYRYNGAECFNVKVPNIGAAKAVYYDVISLKRCIDYCKVNPQIKRPIFYVLACRIGPFIGYFKRQIRTLHGRLYLNPDGHEWLRKKWPFLIRKYWKFSEKQMVKYSDLLICDSKNIKAYIQKEYKKYSPQTIYISYGSETVSSSLTDENPVYLKWMREHKLHSKSYYLAVGRFVPENNFETMIREFMKSHTNRDFVIITTANDRFLKKLESKLHFKQDKRIKFVGTVYEQELLKKIREDAYGYFHGHEVGGTNPSLLEALAFTDLNLLLDVGFNHEVGEDGAIYWTKQNGDLAKTIEKTDNMSSNEIKIWKQKAKKRIRNHYEWRYIIGQYEQTFLDEKDSLN